MLFIDRLVDRVVTQLTAANLCGGNVERDRNEPSDDDDLPCANVFATNDAGKPAGDARAGIPHLEHTTKIVVEVRMRANSGVTLKKAMLAAGDAVAANLLCNLAWMGTRSDGAEGVAGVTQVYNQPPDGNGRTGEVQVQLDVLWRSIWEPETGDMPDLSTVGIAFDVEDGTPQPGAIVTVPTE